ncbi:MAG: peptidase MA family metallohydrolase [Bacilli bacterium]
MINYICDGNTKGYIAEVDNIIKNCKKEILDFFDKNSLDLNCTVYIYDTKQELIEKLNKRGFGKFPDYMCACFKDEDNSLNFYEPPEESENDWTKEEYKKVIFHELIHAIHYNLYGTQPEWLCEGIAMYLDGTYKKGIKYLLENYIINNQIPKFEELQNEFGYHEYDSYDYAYLMVSYLIETLGKKTFLALLYDNEQINNIDKDLIQKSINYYKNKYDLK